MGWESHTVTIADPAEKERAIGLAIGELTASADACRQAGHRIEIVSCGGTGTFPCAQATSITEVQVGASSSATSTTATTTMSIFPAPCRSSPPA